MLTFKTFARRAVPWGLFVTGGALLYFGNTQWELAKRTDGWVQTEGRIIASSVQERTTQGGAGDVPIVLYEFQVGTAIQHGSRLQISDQKPAAHEDAEAVVRDFPVGKHVIVYYNPSLVSQSVLLRISLDRAYLLGGGGIVCVLLAPLTRRVFARKTVQKSPKASPEEFDRL